VIPSAAARTGADERDARIDMMRAVHGDVVQQQFDPSWQRDMHESRKDPPSAPNAAPTAIPNNGMKKTIPRIVG